MIKYFIGVIMGMGLLYCLQGFRSYWFVSIHFRDKLGNERYGHLSIHNIDNIRNEVNAEVLKEIPYADTSSIVFLCINKIVP